MISQLQNSGLLIPSLIVLAGGISVFLYKQFGVDDNYEQTILEEVVRGEVKEITEIFGSELNKKLTYGVNPIGKIVKAFAFKQKVKTEDGNQTVNHFFFKVRDTGLFNFLGYKLFDEGLGFNKNSEYLAPPERFVDDQETVKISTDWHPMKMGGIWVSHGQTGQAVVEDFTYQHIAESTLETAQDVVDMTSNLNLEFVQNIKEMEQLENMRRGNLKQQLDDWMESD